MTLGDSGGSAWQGVAGGLLAGYALAWPWPVYSYVPGLGLRAETVLAAALVALWLVALVRGQLPRIPFAHAWPAGVLIGFAAVIGREGLGWAVAGLMFLATTQLVVSRDRAAQCLVLSGCACGASALLSLTAQAGWVWPTAYSSRALAAGPDSAPLAVLAFAIAPFLILAPGHGWRATRFRTAMAGFTALIAWAAAFGMAGGLDSSTAEGAGWARTGGALVLAWLTARIWAGLVVERKEGHGGHMGLLAALPVALGIGVTVGVTTGAHTGFLLGLAAAFARPEEQPQSMPRFARLAAVAVAGVFVGVNAVHVFPAHRTDPRNYGAAVERALARGDAAAAMAHLADVASWAPGERGIGYWRARAALTAGQPTRAAEGFVAAMRPPEVRQVLPPPDATARGIVLDGLRDAYSGAVGTPAGFGYIRALLAAGHADRALSTLALHGGRGNGGIDSPRMLAAALKALLDVPGLDPQALDPLDGWPAAELEAALTWAHVAQLPGDGSPFADGGAAVAWVSAAGLHIAAIDRDGETVTGTAPYRIAWEHPAGDTPAPLRWELLETGSGRPGAWRLYLGITSVATVSRGSGRLVLRTAEDRPLAAGAVPVPAVAFGVD